jgi:hypothetical protein
MRWQLVQTQVRINVIVRGSRRRVQGMSASVPHALHR